MPSGILLKEVKKLKIEDNHYTYRIETKDSQGSLIDFVDIETVEPLRCAYDVQDELNLETNEHVKRVEEIVLNATSEEFWYVDEARTSNTHLVCYFEEVQLMANADHPMVDTDRSIFGYGKINSNEHQNTNFICTHVLANGVSRIYMSISKEQLTFQVFNNETIKDYISNNPITIWYAIRYPVVIPRSMSKGHLLTLSGQTDITLTTTSEQAKLPIMKFNIGDTQYTLDGNPIHINNTQEGTQIRNIVLEGNTPINYARGNGVNTTEEISNTRYDFAPFYDGQATIPNTVEGGYVSAKLYGDTMVNIAKPYGETPLLTATSESTLCDDLLGANEEGIVLADGEITEGRIVGDSVKIGNPTFKMGNLLETTGVIEPNNTSNMYTDMMEVPLRTFSFYTGRIHTKIAYYDSNEIFIKCQTIGGTIATVKADIPSNAKYVRYGVVASGNTTENDFTWKYEDGTDVYLGIQSVVNPTVTSSNVPSYFMNGNVEQTNGSIVDKVNQCHSVKMRVPTSTFTFTPTDIWNKVVYYDESDRFIRCDYNSDRIIPITSTPPENASYVRYGQQITSGNLSDIFGATWKYEDGTDVYPELETRFTTTHTLNKLPNGVADYIDVVNKVHVQRVGVRDYQETDATDNTVITDTTNTLYELATPIYTPLTEEEIAQLPLSAYKDGYINLSSDQLTPSFEFRMKASNRYQVDMLETGYYYLNAPTGNVKLGTTSVDVQQMPCIVKVDNVGTGDSGYRLATSATGGFNITIPESDMNVGGYFSSTDGAYVQNSNMCYSSIYYEISPNTTYGILSPMNMRIQLYTENQSFIKTIEQNNAYIYFTTTSDTKYFRISYHVNTKKDHTLIANPITLAKLPSHRIPTSFTQGMRCGTDFGYWEGIKVATGKQLYVSDTNKIIFNSIELNRIEYNNTIVEDEFDIATGKLIKRIEKVILDGINYDFEVGNNNNNPKTILVDTRRDMVNTLPKLGKAMGLVLSDQIASREGYNQSVEGIDFHSNSIGGLHFSLYRTRLGRCDKQGVINYLQQNPLTIYYELAVPEISYITLPTNQVKTVANTTVVQTIPTSNNYLIPQTKPSHLTYPVPSLVGNREYTVVHNRKNITGSTKPIELNLGGTVVQLNDASSKTLVKTPSTLAHSNLIFIGGESTVDHIMVLDGDWTNKPIEYFENMKGHDTDAIITIIGDGKIDDVAEQYLW